ncbi:thiamine ABC transporter ATP-binding protein [Ensifer soli]|uniref:thiamine ABC transporter ATP-binding protein n=1 Tax=Ciceribacter sp. sgz301302 TaxID=3342379 RepID=UPI0035BB7C0A
MPDTPALVLSDVRLSYPGIAFRFDAVVAAGETVAVVGPSGAGKSTLFNLIAGFETPESGGIQLFGEDMAGRPPAERPVSIVFQDHNLFAHLDLFTNVGLGIHPALRLTAAERTRITEALARVGLGGFGARKPGTLSGGERQRVALARALVRRRPLLLLDEPFAALDPGRRDDMIGLIRDLAREEGLTVLVITHQPDDLGKLADGVLFLEGGRILLHETVEGLFAEAGGRPEVARFLGLPQAGRG